jgi:hypothetical protein
MTWGVPDDPVPPKQLLLFRELERPPALDVQSYRRTVGKILWTLIIFFFSSAIGVTL